MITVNLTFNSADEMFAFFAPRMAAVAAGAAPIAAPATGDAPKRRGRPPKARIAAAPQEIADAVADPAPVVPVPADFVPEPVEAEADEPEKVWTEPEVREVMKTFNEKFGIDALRVAIVEATGKPRMSEVPAELYGALVARLRREMGAEKA